MSCIEYLKNIILQPTIFKVTEHINTIHMSDDKFNKNFYDTSAYTADISTKMRIPEHINAHGGMNSGGGYSNGDYNHSNSALYDMQVPDR